MGEMTQPYLFSNSSTNSISYYKVQTFFHDILQFVIILIKSMQENFRNNVFSYGKAALRVKTKTNFIAFAFKVCSKVRGC